jgi:glycosyltransferase involved in cell wall biosynthesis
MVTLLIIHPDLSFYGGAELVITEFCRYLGDHRISHDVLTTRVSDEIRAHTPKTNYTTIPAAWNGRWQTGTAYSFWKYLKDHPDWDVINAHNYPVHLAAACSPIPTVWLCNEPPDYHIHYEGIHQPSDLVKKGILSADRWIVRNRVAEVIVADPFNKDRFFHLYHRPAHVIPYGIDYDFFSSGDRQAVVNRYHLDDRFVLLHVGVFTPLKNQMASVRCLEEILPLEPSAVLILAGRGGTSYETEVSCYVQEHNLQDRVIFTGHITREEVRNLYHAADVTLFPVLSQGSWLSPFEALCAGTPVIVSPEITSSSIILEQGIGNITHDYSNAVKSVIKNYPEHIHQADQGRQWVRDNLKWDRFCREMYEQCESCKKS